MNTSFHAECAGPQSLPKVFIVIVNYNGGEIVCKCIESVLKTDYPNFEVILVDNESTDGNVKRISKLL